MVFLCCAALPFDSWWAIHERERINGDVRILLFARPPLLPALLYVDKNHFDLILGVRPWGVLSLSNYVRFVRYILSQGPSHVEVLVPTVNFFFTPTAIVCLF